MRRFIFLFVIGAATAAAAQVTLSLGLHPEHFAPLTFVAPGSAALIIGTALAISGLLGLGEKYQHLSERLGLLLRDKYIDADVETPLRRTEDLENQGRSFWRAYRHAAFALCLFIIGLLAISLTLIDTSLLLYMAGLSEGVAILGIIGLLWTFQALCTARRNHRSAEATSLVLEALPNQEEEMAAPRPRSRVRWSGNKNRKALYPKHLSRIIRTLLKR